MIKKLEFILKENMVVLKMPDVKEDREELLRKLTVWMKGFCGTDEPTDIGESNG